MKLLWQWRDDIIWKNVATGHETRVRKVDETAEAREVVLVYGRIDVRQIAEGSKKTSTETSNLQSLASM